MIASPYFSLNNFVTKFDQTRKTNRQIIKTLKSVTILEHKRTNNNNIFPTYDTSTKMMNFMDVMPLARDNNLPKNIISHNDKQVTSVQMDIQK